MGKTPPVALHASMDKDGANFLQKKKIRPYLKKLGIIDV